MSVRVVTDCSAVVPALWLGAFPIELIPLEVAVDGHLERGELPYHELADRLANARSAPTTAAPSPGVLQGIYERLLNGGESVLVVCPARELSTTYNSAVLAARTVGDERVRVLDARTAAGGQGIVAAEAGRASAEGLDLESVCTRAGFVAARVQVWATLAQLEYLRRSGRLPAIAAIGAGALRLQPIVRYAGSSPAPVGVTRSAARATQRLLRAWERSIVPDAPLRFVAFHSARAGEAEALCESVHQRIPAAEVHAAEVRASLGAHTGPGLLGLAWFWDQ